ncbi:MAG: NAD(P)/FAD-dependent oxidoreductase [Hyphomicrobiales bacterium]
MKNRREKIAVIGSGVSGLSASWLLSKSCDVTLFEADNRLGGHSNTVDVATPEGTVPVDTGFIVYNEATYPNLTALFRHLDVPTELSSMTFSVSFGGGAYEYSGTRASGLFAQRSNFFNAAHWKMIADIVRFFRTAASSISEREDTCTLDELLKNGDYSRAFIERHIVPMGACIWSSPEADVLKMPARAFVEFFENHGLLKISNRPKWRTVSGGSRAYVRQILNDTPAEVRMNTAVTSVHRGRDSIQVKTAGCEAELFDHIVFACHCDDALFLLDDPSHSERALLGAIDYAPNAAVLHTDRSMMPKRRSAWASWNYLHKGSGTGAGPSLTYWMNALQNLRTDKNIFVTLNPARPIGRSNLIGKFAYRHPVFDAGALRAQKNLWSLQGEKNTWFCGAWFGAGFHEDGLQAGLAVAEQIAGVPRPWSLDNPSSRIPVTKPAKEGGLLEAAE